jgi:gas vesicle protein
MGKPTKSKEGIIGEILDQETGKFVDITIELRDRAIKVQSNIELGLYAAAFNIVTMFDEHLYTQLGCSSKSEWIATKCPMGKSRVYMLYDIGKSFFPLLNNDNDNNQLTENASENTSIVHSVDSIGLKKMYELSKLHDDQIKQFVKKGKFAIEGIDYTIEDIKDTSAAELAHIIKESTQKYKSKVSQQSEDINLLKEEMKSNVKELARLKKKEEELDLIQKQYGPMATLIGQKKNYLNDAEKYLDIFQKIFINAGITEEDPEALRQHCQDIVRKIDQYHKNATDNYINVFVE